MYHCHNLLHEDNMMMLQYIVVDQTVGLDAQEDGTIARIYPSPTSGMVRYVCDFPVRSIQVIDPLGRALIRDKGSMTDRGIVDLTALPSGSYIVVLAGDGRSSRTIIHRD